MTIFNEITHATRINILKIILEGPLGLKDIADKLDLSRPEISRQLNKLRSLDLVNKEESLNKITHLGKLILEILGPLNFVTDNFEFFKEHPLINFPSELLFGLNKLSDCEFIVGLGYIFQKEIMVAKIADKHMKLMVNSPIPK